MYEYARSTPMALTDPAGLQAQLWPTIPACKTEGGAATLAFNGKILAGLGISFHAASGVPLEDSGWWSIVRKPTGKNVRRTVFDYSPESWDDKSLGGAPPGKYWLNICETMNWWTSPREHSGVNIDKWEAWGDYHWDLVPYPTTQMYDRDGITLHGGKQLGSAGCIDITHRDREMQRVFADLLKKNNGACCYVDLAVKYPNARVTHLETAHVRTPLLYPGPIGPIRSLLPF